MPAYNEEATIQRILASVLAQDCVFEVVVDDCSTDATPRILNEFAKVDPKVRVFSHERNQG